MKEYPFLEKWRVIFDKAKRRAGVCYVNRNLIAISQFHYLNNSLEIVKDTVLHEFAHAIAFEVFGDFGHGKRWKSIASSIGAVPKATGLFNLPRAPWVLVHYNKEFGAIYKVGTRYRRNRKVREFIIKGMPSTCGELHYLCSEELSLYENGQLLLTELNFIQ